MKTNIKNIFFLILSYFLIIGNTLALEPKTTTTSKKLIEGNDGNGTTQVLGFLGDIFNQNTFIKLFLAFLVIALTVIITKIVKVKLNNMLAKQSDGNDGKEEVFGMITRTINIVILVSGFSLAMGILGVNLGLFMGGIGFGIGFTLKTFLTNFVSGIIMVMNGEYSAGMLIEIGTKKGRIVKVNALMTELEQFDGVRFLVPNIKFLEEYVSNYDRNDKRRLEVYVNLDYKTDILKAKMLATKVMASLPGILQAPEASVLITDLGDNGIRLRVQCWVASKDNFFQAKSNLTETLNLAFKKSDIKVAYPQLTISNRND